MKENEQPSERHKELSQMFHKMGQALLKEGRENGDYITATAGNTMIFMSSTVLSLNETRLLGELLAMVSARKIVRQIATGEFDGTKLFGMVKPNDQTFEEIMRRVKEEQEKKDEEDTDEDDNPDSEDNY